MLEVFKISRVVCGSRIPDHSELTKKSLSPGQPHQMELENSSYWPAPKQCPSCSKDLFSIWTPKPTCITSCKSKKNVGTNAHPWYLQLPWRWRARAQCDSPASGFLWSSTEQQVAAVNVLNVASLCVRPRKTKRASGSMPNTSRAWSLHNWAPPTCLTWEFSPSPAGLRSQDGKKGGGGGRAGVVFFLLWLPSWKFLCNRIIE